MRFHSQSPDATQAAAGLLAASLPADGLLVVLSGPLGAGKTLFAKGIAEGLGVDPEAVTSPTFAISTEYDLADGRRLAHLDGYRLESAAELESAGFLDLLVTGTIILIEWGERFLDALPADRIEIRISRPDETPTQRRLDAVASGPTSTRALSEWESKLVGENGQQLGLELLDEKDG
ncbi:MAG: tRNA (adenosine(37)-N6)-threonylcarbamoyltransferase complex ATPase subunit type 1 TsaE [Deltaproteobacteria bacterium]|jgi:tRNA threonylcarbamoyladenosine biosynthesis protein TsaE|nr:tRNA (adenosine(37)-N6)-threonylcarbamoyltransferase complex ATPase subunit type 1 TsaE [Deltaproteobacteria bacterium]